MHASPGMGGHLCLELGLSPHHIGTGDKPEVPMYLMCAER